MVRLSFLRAVITSRGELVLVVNERVRVRIVPTQISSLSSNPERPLPVLENYCDIVTTHTTWIIRTGAVAGELPSSPVVPVQACAVGSDPDHAVPILAD